jgi:hypothetical protein
MPSCEVHGECEIAGICRSCGGEFCIECLVYSFGEGTQPFCVDCAVTASRPPEPSFRSIGKG